MTLRVKTAFLLGGALAILSLRPSQSLGEDGKEERKSEVAGSGGVRVVSINGGATVNGRALHVGETVQLGDWIKTSAHSGAKLLMPDRSVVDVGPNTRFRVENAKSDATDGQLEWGSVRASIQKKLEGKTKFRVRTKSSVLSARGTEFVVNSLPKAGAPNVFVDQVTVRSGIVEMQVPGLQNLMLDAGKQVSALAQVGPQGQIRVDPQSFRPVELPNDALQKTMGSATVSDDTFRQVVVVPSGERSPNSDGSGQAGPNGNGPNAGGTGSVKAPAPTSHFGQDALAGATIKAANDPEGGMRLPPPTPGTFGFRPPPPPPFLPGLNGLGGSNVEKKLNEGVNVTVVFQL